jgi:hypothetical protein
MLSVGIFMIGVSGIVTLQLAGRRGRVAANDISLATNLASSTLDELETVDFVTLANTSVTYDRQGGTGGVPFFTVATVVTPAVGGGVVNVVATVSWTVEGNAHSVSLQGKVAAP